VIDTVDLFFIPSRQRKLSLRYLAWYILGETIQTVTHDSIEDARTAMRLYRKYLEYEDAGVLDNMLVQLYAEGKRYNFKPPSSNADDQIERSETPPILQEQAIIPHKRLPTSPLRTSLVTKKL